MWKMESQVVEEEENPEDEGENQSNCNMITCTEFLDDDIIDISMLDFDDQETWLLHPTTSKSSFDLNKWLKNDDSYKDDISPSDLQTENNTIGSPIDTRTFTRPKKKFGKINFDSIKQDRLTTVTSDNNESCGRLQINWEEEKNRSKDCIPLILNQSQLGFAPFSINGQESLEAFVNMSQSKGIDSFINMPEPEFHESFMNISRTSILQNTISNDSMNQTGNTTIIGMADSQILTDSMMQTSIFNDTEDSTQIHFNDTFTQQCEDNSFISNVTCTLNSDNCKEVETKADDVTFTSTALNPMILDNPIYKQHESFIINKTFDNMSLDNCNLSYTVSTEGDIKFPDTAEVRNLNSTFCPDNLAQKIPLNSTFQASEIDSYALENRQFTQPEVPSLFMQHREEEIVNQCEDNDLMREESETCVFPVIKSQSTSVTPVSQKFQINSHNATFSKKDLQYLKESTRNIEELSAQDENYDSQSYNLIKSNIVTEPLSTNRYQTYRKLTTINQRHRLSKIVNSTDRMPVMSDEIRGSSTENLSSANQRIESQRNFTKITEAKFSSRLASQNFQKSNPNLTFNSSDKKQLKIIQKSNFGFNVDARRVIRNGDSTSLHGLNNVGESRAQSAKYEARASNESIESTQSVPSEIDFDDQLSTCSDSSQLVKSMKSKNFRHLVQNYHVKNEKTNHESTPKSVKKAMENTWIVSEKDLPSPILKNCEIPARQVGISDDMNSEPKTSSPLLSPAESLQSLTTNLENHAIDEPQGASRLPESLSLNKPVNSAKSSQNYENKTGGARIPTNRPASTASGIPRPASRIPAPKNIRTNTRIKQQINSKKSIL